ncbi:transcription intermediary factor 1-beta-like [Mytilus edulis]|uniref:transcription intermediary factor 1-beta-like n=1 Tax=Mytilus edulis TaxID=6550 RepID=UPI0039F03AA4
MAQIQSNKCKTCEKDNASYFCYECQYYLCEPCKLLHDKFLKKHTVTESYKIDKSVFASILKCGRHDLKFAHYCKDCKCLTCSECTTSGHKSHEFTNVSEVAASIRTDLNEANCKAKAKLEILSRLIEEIQNVKMKKVKAENDQFVKEARKIERELIRIIESVTEQNVNRASDFLILEQLNLNYEIANLKKLKRDCRSVTETIEQVIK